MPTTNLVSCQEAIRNAPAGSAYGAPDLRDEDGRLPGCPPWCTRHFVDPDDGSHLHQSDRSTVRAKVEREVHDIGVELCRLDLAPDLAAEADLEPGGDGRPSVFLQGAGQADMTPEQALELAGLLVEQANRALDSDGKLADSPLAFAFECGRRAERILRNDYWKGYVDAIRHMRAVRDGRAGAVGGDAAC